MKNCKADERGGSRLGHIAMGACCALMVAGGALVVFGSLAGTGRVDWIGAILPLAACLTVHLVLHRWVIRAASKDAPDPVPAAQAEAQRKMVRETTRSSSTPASWPSGPVEGPRDA